MRDSEIQVLRIERHDPHRVAAIYPKGHKDRPEGGSVTILEELRMENNLFPRRDIILINFWRNGETVSRQRFMDAYDDGIPRGDAEEFLTPEDLRWCREENARILAAAAEYPEMSIYLRKVR